MKKLAAFRSEENLLQAVHTMTEANYHSWDIATPADVEKIEEQLGRDPRARVFAFIGSIGGASGILIGFLMQWYSAAIEMQLNIGGRPFNSWPTFVPITFILMILGAALSLVASFFISLRFPQIYHPLFFADSFDLSSEHYYLIYGDDFTADQNLKALSIEEISWIS